MTYLIQILLPLFDNDGRQFGRDHFIEVRDQLTNAYGGLTSYSRAPVEGLWREDGASVQHDDLVIYEVMTSDLDRSWWRDYRQQLELRFRQERIIVHAQRTELL